MGSFERLTDFRGKKLFFRVFARKMDLTNIGTNIIDRYDKMEKIKGYQWFYQILTREPP